MKKTLAMVLALMMVLCVFAGCEKSGQTTTTHKVTESTQTPKTESNTDAATTAAATEIITTEAVTEAATTEAVTEASETAPVVETTAALTAPETPAATGEAAEQLKDYEWSDGVIVIDGVLYRTYDDPYMRLEENGWSFDLADYGKDESYSLNSMEYVFATIHLSNVEKYGDGYSNPELVIGIINTSDSLQPIKDCNIHGIKASGVSGFTTFESKNTPIQCYDFAIPGGLHRGSTMEEVKAAYGEPEDVYVADGDNYHYEVLTYKNDEKKVTIKLTVFPEDGLQTVEISNSRQWLR